ncbi:AI-2E family transporter [Lysobacter rhizosphaerae]
MLPGPNTDQPWSQTLLDVLLRVGLIALLLAFCFRVFQPFLSLMLWSVILAITLYPLHLKLRPKLGNKDGLTATLITLVVALLLAVPAYLLCMSLVTSSLDTMETLKGNKIQIPAPWPSVNDLPIIGPRLHEAWQQVANDPHAAMEKLGPQFKPKLLKLLGTVAGFATGFLLFMAALPITGIIMAFGARGTESAVRIASALVGPVRGPPIVALCTATVRAVAQGVIGIAFIQAVLIGVGLVLLDVPGAPLLILAVLLLGIMQVPVTLVTIPVIIYVFATRDASVGNIVLAIYIFLAGLSDNVLKPLLLGRGVEVPMPVVLIGALGGMIVGGLLGLFIGPVVLGIGYILFWQWVEDHSPARASQPDTPPT